MIDWQPISVGPRNGEPVLAFVSGGGQDFDEYVIAFWKRDGWVMQEDDKLVIRPTHWAKLTKPAP